MGREHSTAKQKTHTLQDRLQIRLTLRNQCLECQVDASLSCAWRVTMENFLPKAPMVVLKKSRSFRDERVAVDCLRTMQLQESTGSGDHVRNVLAERPWLGSSGSLPRRSP